MSRENHAGNAIDDGFGDGAHDLGRERAEIFPGSRAERNRAIAIVEDPISRIDLPVFPISRGDKFMASVPLSESSAVRCGSQRK
jgi:hypothetical protein